MDTPVPGPRFRAGTPILMTIVATLGFGLNFWSWGLLASFGPLLRERYGLDSGAHVALIAVPLLLGSAARLPVGVFTDRYGARVMLPAVSIAAALPVFAAALADSAPSLIASACLAGLGGAAFAAGVPLVVRSHPPGRRGFALGVFGTGNAGAAVAGMATQWWAGVGEVRTIGLLLGVLLVGYAIAAATLVRDPDTGPHRPFVRECAEAMRAATVTLSVLYAAAFGVVLVLAFYLPSSLSAVYGIDPESATSITAAVVAVAAASRVLGGRLADRADTLPMLAASYLVVGVLILVLALQRQATDLMLVVLVLAGLAVADGIAAGIVLGLLGKAAAPDRIGAMAGITGAAGGLGALFVPLLVTAVHRLNGSYPAAMTLLASLLFGVGIYVLANSARIPFGLVLPARAASDPSHATLTVAVASTQHHMAVQAISDLAQHDELVVVAGRVRPGLDSTLIAMLRAARPGSAFVGLLVDAYADSDILDGDVNLVAELLNSGSTPVLVTSPAGDAWVALYLAHRLAANRVVEIMDDRTDGVTVRQMWVGPKHDPRARVIA